MTTRTIKAYDDLNGVTWGTTARIGEVASGGAGTPYVLTQTLGTVFSSGSHQWLGMRFDATATNTITELGRWVVSGNNQTHILYLISFTTTGSAFHDLGHCTVDTNGATAGQYVYCTLSSPVVIDNSDVTPFFYVLSEEGNGDQSYLDDTTIDSVTAGIGTMDGAAVDNSNVPPTAPMNPGIDVGGSKAFGPVNFKVQ